MGVVDKVVSGCFDEFVCWGGLDSLLVSEKEACSVDEVYTMLCWCVSLCACK